MQRSVPTIESTLRATFNRIFKQDLYMVGASRTDAGVHAVGQVALMATNLAIDSQRLIKIWNSKLPFDIYIRSMDAIKASFHPWYNVQEKIYYYHFFVTRPLPFVAPYGWYYPYPIDYDKLRQALNVFEGTHNFRAFSCKDDTRTHTVRTINSIRLHYLKRFNVYRIEVRGARFLRHMIRRIVGAALQVATQPHLTVAMLTTIRDACDPDHVLVKAPPQGLLLYKISYIKE